MIHKNNCQVGNTKNVTVAEFGYGTLGIAHSTHSKAILLKTIKKTPIGTIDKNVTLETFEPELVIFFRNKESFDVFFKHAENIKKEFEKEHSNLEGK